MAPMVACPMAAPMRSGIRQPRFSQSAASSYPRSRISHAMRSARSGASAISTGSFKTIVMASLAKLWSVPPCAMTSRPISA